LGLPLSSNLKRLVRKLAVFCYLQVQQSSAQLESVGS